MCRRLRNRKSVVKTSAYRLSMNERQKAGVPGVCTAGRLQKSPFPAPAYFHV